MARPDNADPYPGSADTDGNGGIFATTCYRTRGNGTTDAYVWGDVWAPRVNEHPPSDPDTTRRPGDRRGDGDGHADTVVLPDADGNPAARHADGADIDTDANRRER